MPIYSCDICMFSTDNIFNYKKHETTIKHLNQLQNPGQYNCKKCNKTFHSHTGRWYHTKKCIQIPPIKTKDETAVVMNQIIQQQNNTVVKMDEWIKKKGSSLKDRQLNLYFNTQCKNTENNENPFENLLENQFEAVEISGKYYEKYRLLRPKKSANTEIQENSGEPMDVI